MHLPGTPDDAGVPLRRCSKCGNDAKPHGGIEISPGRWLCTFCWRRPLLASNRKKG